MWYRSGIVAGVMLLAVTQIGWAQPGGGGRSQEEALRKLEREVAELKAELKKLQTAQKQQGNRPGGPGMADRRGGPGGPGRNDRFGGPPSRGQMGPGPMGRGQMAFGGPGRRPGGPQQFGQWRGFRGNPMMWQQMHMRGFGQHRPGNFGQFGRPQGPGAGFGGFQQFGPGGPPPRGGFGGGQGFGFQSFGGHPKAAGFGPPRPGERRPETERRPPRPE